MVGDFNVVMYEHEVVGSFARHRSCQAFRNCMMSCNLFDAGFQGSSYTWRRNNLRECLDRALINNQWALSFQDMGAVHLPFLNLDHSPLWVHLGEFLITRNPKPFKFMVAWLNHDDFRELVSSNWNKFVSWNDNVSQFTPVAAAWNKNVFGNIHRRKMRLINRLHGIQRASHDEPNPFLNDLQNRLLLEYEMYSSF